MTDTEFSDFGKMSLELVKTKIDSMNELEKRKIVIKLLKNIKTIRGPNEVYVCQEIAKKLLLDNQTVKNAVLFYSKCGNLRVVSGSNFAVNYSGKHSKKKSSKTIFSQSDSDRHKSGILFFDHEISNVLVSFKL